MNIAQHATNILEAWKFQDRSSLGIALESASVSCKAAQAASRLESEREEMLQSIVEHLRLLADGNQLPDPSKNSGALTLLSHLSSDARNRGYETTGNP